MERLQFLQNIDIGISISEHKELANLGFSYMHVQDALVEISRYILSCGGNLSYGGNVNYQPEFNFVEVLFQLVAAYNKENKKSVERIKNYCAFPMYNKITPEQKRDYEEVARFIYIQPPEDLEIAEKLVKSTTKHKQLMKQIDALFKAENVNDNYVWARTMTEMRMQMNQDVQAKVVLGGKKSGYKGIYPGLVEETYYTLKTKKPVYLIGAFGGCSQVIIDALQGGTPKELTDKFQFESNDYKELVAYYNEKVKSIDYLELIDYEKLTTFFHKKGKENETYGLNNGLSKKENEKLFTTIHIPEMIGLILKGLKTVFSKQQ